MKNFKIASLLLLSLLFSITLFTSCHDDDNDTPTIVELLTEEEKADLIFMREEEKLARVVYTYLYDEYGLFIFDNISASEQIHMDAVLTELVRYGITDPASTEVGVFNNADLQILYDNLIVQGDLSLVDALTVGATIEDVDIRDLNMAIATTSKNNLITMYEKLFCGSRNHLRGFINQLSAQGETYTPQYISVQEYEDILNDSHENCGG